MAFAFLLPGAVALQPPTPRLSSGRSPGPKMYDEGFFHELMQRKLKHGLLERAEEQACS